MIDKGDTHVHSIVDEDGAVILDIERNAFVRLNANGGFVWEKLQAGNSIRDIVLALAQETNTEIETVERDVRAFLDDLKSRHLNSSPTGLANANG